MKWYQKTLLLCTLALPLTGCSSLIVPGTLPMGNPEAASIKMAPGPQILRLREFAVTTTHAVTKTFRSTQGRTFQCQPREVQEEGKAAITLTKPLP